jgi:prolyl 4-hydroxylase
VAKVKLKSPEQRLAEVGKSVARRLAAPGKSQLVKGNGLVLYTIQNFLSLDECAALMALIDRTREPSTLLAEHPDQNFRTSDSANLDNANPLVATVEARICALMGINPRYAETMQGQVYEVGQQFKPHFDYFKKHSDYWDRMMACGGQRSWTAMAYLNQPAAGGETHFPSAGLMVQPVQAMLLLWNNMNPDGTPNDATLHEGCPVLAGTKYIFTKWFRERFWQ